jgi:hypothetical protein
VGLIVTHAEVQLTAKDGTVFLVGNLQIISGTYCNANGLEKRKVPGSGEQAERFKQLAMKNTLDQMLEQAASAREQMAKRPAASQGDVVMVMVGDFDLQRAGVTQVLNEGGSKCLGLSCLSLADGPGGPVQRDWLVTDRPLLEAENVPRILSHDNMHRAVVADLLPFAAPAAAGAASPGPELSPPLLGVMRNRVERLKEQDVKRKEQEDRKQELCQLAEEAEVAKRQRRSDEEAGCVSRCTPSSSSSSSSLRVRACSVAAWLQSVILWQLASYCRW